MTILSVCLAASKPAVVPGRDILFLMTARLLLHLGLGWALWDSPLGLAALALPLHLLGVTQRTARSVLTVRKEKYIENTQKYIKNT